MNDKNLRPILGLGIGLMTAITVAVYQHVTLRNQIQQLESKIEEQGNTIETGQKTLVEREAEIDRKETQLQEKEKQIQEKEKQIQDQSKQLQAKESDLRNQKAEVARQQQIASDLRANTETLSICLQGVMLAIIATTPAEKAVALGAIEAKCEEAAEIVEELS